ncbi:hypothetical protein PN450_11465, partial [Dolichospermum lemmermannii CS-548]|nr:hypothetical protein [Dolichospermum lemmermannii CS-548]
GRGSRGGRGAGENIFSHYQLPITNYQLPITNYQLPITNYLLPITHYPLPITYYLFCSIAMLLQFTS